MQLQQIKKLYFQDNKDNNQRVKYNQKTQKETTKPEQKDESSAAIVPVEVTWQTKNNLHHHRRSADAGHALFPADRRGLQPAGGRGQWHLRGLEGGHVLRL